MKRHQTLTECDVRYGVEATLDKVNSALAVLDGFN
jgi:hypothetical protein